MRIQEIIFQPKKSLLETIVWAKAADVERMYNDLSKASNNFNIQARKLFPRDTIDWFLEELYALDDDMVPVKNMVPQTATALRELIYYFGG